MLEGKTTGPSLEEAFGSALRDPNVHLRQRATAGAARVLDPDMLIGAVADQDDAVRRNAAIEVLARGGARSVPALLRALRHDDPEVVMFAAGILGRTRDATAIPHLLALLDHDDINIVQGVIESLGHLRATPAVEPLLALFDRDPWLRFAAIHALGEIGDARAAAPLVALLDDEEIAESAILALGRIGTPDVLGPLAVRLRRACNDEAIFSACLRAIGDALEQLPDERIVHTIASVRDLASTDAGEVHLRLLEILSAPETGSTPSSDTLALRAAAIDLIRALRMRPFYGALVRAGREPLLRDALQFALLTIGAECTQAVAGNLANTDANVRLLACRAAGALSLTSLTASIEPLLRDRVDAVRAAAVHASARLAGESCLSAIVPMLADSSEEVRVAAAAALPKMGAQAMTRALTLTPNEPFARALAVEAMRANPDPTQRGLLLGYLRDPYPPVRRGAVAALARQGGATLVEELEPLLVDPQLEVRREVVTALGELRHPRVRALLVAQLVRDPKTRPHTIRALAEQGDPAVAPLLAEMLGDESPLTRMAIIEALAALDEPTAEPHLVRMLSDSEAEVRRTAVEAFTRFGGPAASRHGLAAARDPSWQVRAAAVELLAKPPEGGPSDGPEAAASAALERLCFDPVPFVSDLARRRLDETKPV